MKGCRETDDSSSCSEDDIENQAQSAYDDDDDDDPLSSIYFRPLQPSDRDQIKRLHEEWFPVTYKDEFYDDLVLQRMVNSGEELYTCAAVLLHDDYAHEPDLSSYCSTTNNTDEQQQQQQHQEEHLSVWQQLQLPDDDDEIVACVVGSFVEASRMSAETAQLLVADPTQHTRMFYLMTLGTVTEFRHLRLATMLVQRVMSIVEEDAQCACLYLHVITFNQAAIRFYEKLGFYRVTEMKDYYRIDDKNYNCYIYAKSFHGNRTHIDYYYLLTNLVTSIWRTVTTPFLDYRSLTNGPGAGPPPPAATGANNNASSWK